MLDVSTFFMNPAVLVLKKWLNLLEVTIVVVIIGILVTVAYPAWRVFAAHKTNWSKSQSQCLLYTTQKIFFAINWTYADSPGKLYFELESGASSRYEITLTEEHSSFTATSMGNLNDDTALDIWTIDQNKNLQNILNDITPE